MDIKLLRVMEEAEELRAGIRRMDITEAELCYRIKEICSVSSLEEIGRQLRRQLDEIYQEKELLKRLSDVLEETCNEILQCEDKVENEIGQLRAQHYQMTFRMIQIRRPKIENDPLRTIR